tara:strand:+ start:573 stop:1151 length:579 start_codon:yes stop_codon:yes gene_type:complete
MEAKNFDHLLGMEGISDGQLKAHFKLYEGYVGKLNEIREKLGSQDKTKANYSFGEFSELKRREVVAFNGAFLHEIYFESLGKEGAPSEEFKDAVDGAFGSWDNFVTDVKGSAVSTPGWVLVTLDKTDGKVHTYVLYEHHIGLPVHQEIVLALDCWEHAFMIDYGTDKASYLEAFLKNINWNVVNKRFEEAKK